MTVFPTASGEASLQSILNSIWIANPPTLGYQISPGLFMNTSGPGGASTNLLRAEWASNAPTQSFGVFSPGAEPVPIFTGSAAPGDVAMLQWDATGTMLAITRGGFTNASHVNEGIFTGMNVFAFGFFLDTGAARYFTVDELNAPALNPDGETTRARALTIQGRETEFAFAFESGSDFDYNELVAKVESITPVPEPASVVLLGAILLGCARRLWPRYSH